MRKSTAITALLILVPFGLRAEEGLKNHDAMAMAHVQANPLMLLPGMAPIRRSLLAAPVSALPKALITDVTNYPNPFDSRKSGLDGQTDIAYSLAQDSKVSMTLYDLLGGRVREWSFRPGESGGRLGNNQILWDGSNEAGQKVSKGGYMAEIQVETPGGAATVIRKIGVIH